MIKETEIIEKLWNVATELFESTGFIKVIDIIKSNTQDMKSFNNGFIPDLICQVQVREADKYFFVFEIKSLGQPRYARMAANQIKSAIGSKPKFYGVFGAPFISEESKRICRENDIGFIDLAGNCLLKFDGVYVNIDGRTNPYPTTRPLKSIFSPRSTRALRVLLTNPKKSWFVKDLAREANISLGQASNIKKRLLEYELIEETTNKRGKKFRLSDPQTLLTKWADNYSYRSNKIKNYYSLDDVKVIENKLAQCLRENQTPYAFTMTSGVSRVEPFLRYQRAFCYVGHSTDRIAQELGLKEVSSGPNVSLLLPYDEGVFYGLQEIQDVKVVSDVQLYLDLKSYKERGEEAAEFILEQRLKKQW